MIVTRKTPLEALTLSPEWFEQLHAVRLNVRPADLASCRASVARLAAQIAADVQPFDYLAEVERHRTGRSAQDTAPWTVTIGDENDTRASGITVTSNVTHGGNGQYWVVVNTSGGEPARRLHEFALANPKMSVERFVATPEYAVAEHWARRNAQRLAALIAGAIDVDRPLEQIVRVTPDIHAATPAENYGRELLAVPTHSAVFNRFELDRVPPVVRRYDGGQGALYIGREVSLSSTNTILKILDPSKGFLIRHHAEGGKVDVESVKSVITHEAQDQNTAYWKSKTADPTAHREHVYAHYVNRRGEKPSSAAKALWHEESNAVLLANDIQLAPFVLIIDAKQAASETRGGKKTAAAQMNPV
jgi:hypothetical protein